MSRHHPLARDAHIHALLSCPLIHDLGGDLDAHRRRAPAHPLALHLAYGALARLYGSTPAPAPPTGAAPGGPSSSATGPISPTSASPAPTR